MKRHFINRVQNWALMLCLLVPLQRAAAQFVELTSEIELNDWDYWFLEDEHNVPSLREDASRSIFIKSRTVRCVVGTESWMMETAFNNGKFTRWFTGTNIIEHTLITNAPDANARQSFTGLAGQQFTRVEQSADGNPGRPGGVADLMTFDVPGRICWLAFCSGPCLRRDGRKIFPPSDFWKESSIFYYGWSDQTEVFKDDLGLPKSINLVSTNNQSIFRYQVRQSTNVLGWNFPLEFYGVQYLSTGTNAWKLHLTLKGRVTAIAVGNKPEIPEELLKAAAKAAAK